MLKFGTKSETLKLLEDRLVGAKILPQIMVTVKEWNENVSEVFQKLALKGWLDTQLIIRSSALLEDSEQASCAGKYLSIPHVIGIDSFTEAVNKVIQSYSNGDDRDQILIQPMLEHVKLSGVAFSVNPNNGGNYFVINYDDTTTSLSSVTSGQGNIKTYYYFKQAPVPALEILRPIVRLIVELEELFETEKLDIEFAVDEAGCIFLLQVRPLIVNVNVANKYKQHTAIHNIYMKIKQAQVNKPYLYGNKTMYGVMPDWNPAEIIGIKPRPLALSLYKELVTDNIWAYQRDNYGYKNLRSFPLLLSFAGTPYIDVRVSFNSFLSKEFDEELSQKLIHYYLYQLAQKPENHDKVEFEIIFSCFTFDIYDRIQKLKQYDFDADELDMICENLKRLTNQIISMDDGLLLNDYKKISELKQRRENILNSQMDKISKIYWLLEDCKRYGTLPFAGLARGAFIAVQMLRSLVAVGILSTSDYQNFMSGLETVNSQMNEDLYTLPFEDFLQKYGHLRPGTYDILSRRYDEAPEQYFNVEDIAKKRNRTRSKKKPFMLCLTQLNQIDTLLLQFGLHIQVLPLFDFFKAAIEGRELAKFEFTKNLSIALQLIGELTEENDLSIEDASYININVIKQAYESDHNIRTLLNKSMVEGKQQYAETLQINLPMLIVEPENVWGFHLQRVEPNYITLKKAMGRVVVLTNSHNKLKGSILLIPSADPGFDWIFSQEIAGFITMYGGANSHMAIRANEMLVPAVIGVGDYLYNQFEKVECLEINCAVQKVRIIR
ncbi:phosphoenolpyruvate synthase [Paenibacillus sp. EKM208P]|uniref:PEP/pyruvate-binding domain-containing protein n=1 Tax=Paenibacillus polymyxa TaxID=1406 RepID=UPI000F8FF541|nr:phosphoenolpyruvate synthase [Paenibacillus sp. EKM208P]